MTQWKPRLDERAALWLAKRKRAMNADDLPVSESDLLQGSRQAFYVVAELLAPTLEKKDVPSDDSLRKLFTPLMVRWYHEYREEYSLETRRERKEKEDKLAEEEGEDDDMPVEDEAPVLWDSKHEVMDLDLLRWEDNQGIIKFTSAARFPYAISGRMLFDHVRCVRIPFINLYIAPPVVALQVCRAERLTNGREALFVTRDYLSGAVSHRSCLELQPNVSGRDTQTLCVP
jgi:hypothetical protein